MGESLRKWLSALLACVFFISVALLAVSFLDARKNDAAYQTARSMAGVSPQVSSPAAPARPRSAEDAVSQGQVQWVSTTPIDDPVVQALQDTDLQALRQKNADVVGWIHIPDTAISYPLLQGQDNQHYLNHTWENQRNYGGSIYLETRNDPAMTDFNTIVYGHNMKNGSMFAALHDYTTVSHWESHPYVYVVTDDAVLRYEVFSSYNADVEGQTYALSFQQTQTREAFIAMALENSEFDTGRVPVPTDRILTLSTCTGLGYAQRRVVHAFLPTVQVIQ